MKTSLKEVKIIARYSHKTNGKLNGIITYAVRSSKGDIIYCTTLINGKASGCSCPSNRPCYHMNQLVAIEAARTPLKVVKSEPVESTSTQVILPKPDMMKAALTTNRGFQLMR